MQIFFIKDDDLYLRALAKYDKIIKLSPQLGRYYTALHSQAEANPER